MKIVSCEHFFKLKYYKMKLSLRLLLLLPFIFILAGCPGDDAPQEVPVRTYSEVYAQDIVEIEEFMNNHYMSVDANNNVTFTKITASTPGTPISSHPDLTFKTISKGGVDHKLYFISLQGGIGNTDTDSDTTNDNPTRLDSVFTAYKGTSLNKDYVTNEITLNDFDEASTPIWLELEDLIQGWQEIYPEFKIGNSVTDFNTGLSTFSGYGAGVVFIPSGLAYFNRSPPSSSISPYTPLIFNFKLIKLRYKDHDADKLLSKDEYGGPTSGNAKDSDGDGKPDYKDFDDDNDGKITKEEIRRTPGVSRWYPFKGAAVDDPATLDIDERQGIPSCSGDYTSPNRLRRHLDFSCK
jgi:FKBP-type peptidyl-prolyl cis-trans isomerase FkpA